MAFPRIDIEAKCFVLAQEPHPSPEHSLTLLPFMGARTYGGGLATSTNRDSPWRITVSKRNDEGVVNKFSFLRLTLFF